MSKNKFVSESFRGVQPLVPMTRVRTIMKSSPEITQINQDILFVVAKATELFINQFCREAFKNCSKANEMDYKKLADLVANEEKFEFLSEIVPHKVKAKDALKEIEANKISS
ncbi:chromatin accessibility complex 1 [Brachionus plicatilis]|uniref:Chromatin accessibility complex protein 1 n=1 Tax=Brachionus plicatilis TaxID=10195 RepID=A0A3M7PW40_BRAPC|nr:chromatin accessibility complex 1 [Brachionus plicatilis]